MSIRDIQVVISRDTKAVTQAGFGSVLILATSKDHEYTEYMDLQAIASDFAEDTKEYKIANRILGQNPRPEKVSIAGISYDGTNPTDLITALNSIDGDFYFVVSPEQGDEEITAISEWVDSQKKLYFASTANKDLPALLESERTVLMVHNNPESYPAEGWVGRCAPTLPGSITWKFKTINGISESGTTLTEDNEIKENGGNTYIRQGGILMAVEGITTSGEFIDVIRSQDFIESRMTENVFRALATADKVPYTNQGIKIIGAEVDTTLKQAFNQGIIAEDEDGNPMYSITLPTRDSVSTNDRANRVLPDIYWELDLAGAIHAVKPISGVIRV